MQEKSFWPKISSIRDRVQYNIQSISDHKLVRDARSKGTIGAVEIDSGGKSSYFNNSGKFIYKKLLDKGVILRPLGNVFPIVTPYCISFEDIDYIFQSLKEVLDEMIA